MPEANARVAGEQQKTADSQDASQSLVDQLQALKAARGDMVKVSDIADIVRSMLASMHGEMELATVKVSAELRELIDFINSAKADIAALNPHAMSKRDLPGAADELDAIVQHTEAAAGQIMDCAEEVSAIAASVDGELADTLVAISTKIFEASSFQDITGQRVTKVVRVLKHIEEKLAALAEAIGDEELPPEDKARDATGVPLDDKDLLNGPQLEGQGNNQDDIDALLASFD